jgi:hypothetical protein
MKYSKEITENHPLSSLYNDIVIQLNALLKREGASKNYFCNNITVLDLDLAETKRNRSGMLNETMDFSMGLKCKKMLLVEIKLNTSNPANLSETNLKNKIRYSKELLSGEIPLSKNKIFLFKETVINNAKHVISRYFNNNPNIKIYTISQFKAEYFD